MTHATPTDQEPSSRKIEMIGGLAGAAVPPLIFVGVLFWLSFEERASIASFWVGAVAALIVGLVLTKTKRSYAESLVDGLADRTGIIIVVAFIFAGIFGAFMQEGGLTGGLLWLGQQTGLQGAAFTAFAFLLTGVFGTGIGTSVGTITALLPVIFPAGVFLGADPTMLAVAILAGGALGDNLSPISDTTIASAYTQHATMGSIVKSRLPLVLSAAAVSLVVFLLTGGGGTSMPEQEVQATSSPIGLIMLIPFALVIFLAVKGRHIFESLVWGTLLALVLSLITGTLGATEIFNLPSERGESTGLIEDAISGVTGPVILVLLILGITRVLENSGIMKSILSKLRKTTARGVRTTELSIVGSGVLFTIPLGANAPAILMLGPSIAKPLGETHGLSPQRRANLLDCAVCTVFYMLPWHNAVIVWFGVLMATANTYGLDFPSIWSAGWNPYAWALLLVVVVSALTGWNRSYVKTA